MSKENREKQKDSESLEEESKKGVVREYVEAILIALVIALFLRHFIIEAFKIPSASMVPTLLVGDHIFVNKFVYGIRIPFTNKKILEFRQPKRGEIIVFIYPHDTSKDYIKRVVGIAGDKIHVRDDQLFINDQKVEEEYQDKYLYSDINQRCIDTTFEKYMAKIENFSFATLNDKARNPSNYGPIWVEEGKLFVMGDNRDNSSDSRVWGFVPMENVKGKSLFIWLSVNGCGLQSDTLGGKIENTLLFRWVRGRRFFQGLH